MLKSIFSIFRKKKKEIKDPPYRPWRGIFTVDKVESTVDVKVEDITKVSATDIDIRSLTYTRDSILSYQGGSWTVSVNNFPSTYPLPSDQVSDLKKITVVGSDIAYDSTNDVFKFSIEIDNVGLAKESTLQSFKNQAYDSSNDVYKVHVLNTPTVSVNNFPSDYPDSTAHNKLDTIHSDLYDSDTGDKAISVLQSIRDKVATESTLSSINSKITKCDTDNVKIASPLDANGNVKVAVQNFPTDYAKESTLSDLNSKVTKCDTDNVKIVSPLSANNNVNVNIAENTAGIATESTLSDIKSKIDVAISTRASEDTLLKNLRSIAVQPATGYNAHLYSTDSGYEHWIDDTDRSFTSTDYTVLTKFHILFPHLSFARTFGLYVSVKVRGDGTNTVYIRIRSAWRGTLIEFSTTSSNYVHIERRTSYKGMIHWDDLINIEGKVSGGTGYLDFARARLIKVNVVEGWTGEVGDDHFHPIKIDSDGTVHTRIAKSSIAYDASNDRFKVGVQNFPSWFTGSTKKTDDLWVHLDNIRSYFGRYFNLAEGNPAHVYVAYRDVVFWQDKTDYSFTNTSYTDITVCYVHGLMMGFVGVSTEIHGDGTNTVYCRVVDRGGHVLYEWSTTSASAVRTWRKGFMAHFGFPDFNKIRVQCKVDSGTGYLTNVYAVIPAEDNRRLVLGWNYVYSHEGGCQIYPWRVDGSGAGMIFPKWASNISHGSVTVGTSATQIVGANTNRTCLVVFNNSNNWVYLGGSGVTTGNGLPLPPKSYIVLERYTGALYGIASASSEIRYLEVKY